MKSYCKGLVIDKELILTAIATWRAGESGRENRWRIAREHGSDEMLADELVSEIRTRTLTFAPIKYSTRKEPTNKKLRVIGQESVKQQIADYTVIIAMEQFLNARIGFYQVSSVKGKGSLFAGRTIQKWCYPALGYWVHIDIRKCYPSISKEVLLDILYKYIKSDDVLYVCECILATYENGLNIGSYFSLKMAQLVLSFGYHYLEDLHKIRRGKRVPLITHQLWYADDIYLFANSKRDLKLAVGHLMLYLHENFNLHIHEWQVCRVGTDEPVTIALFKCDQFKMTLKPDLYLRARRAFTNFEKHPTIHNARRVCSYWGIFKHSDAYQTALSHGYDRIFRQAKRYISRYDRRVNDQSSKIRNKTRIYYEDLS